MRSGAIAMGVSLIFAVFTMWIEERWAWSLIQAVLFAIAACHAAFGRIRPPAWAHLPLLAAAVWPFVQLAAGTTASTAPTWSAGLDWLTFLVVFMLAFEYAGDPRIREGLMRGAALFGMALAVIAVTQRYTSAGRILWLFPSGFKDDVFGPFVNRNQFAAWLELLLPAALYLTLKERHLRALYGAAAATILAAIVASASRAGFALAIAEILLTAMAIVATRRNSWRTLSAASLQFAVIALFAAATVGWQGLWTRMSVTPREALRADALRASAQMVQERPWFGSGLGTWSTIYPRHASFDTGVALNQAHNDWAQWAAEGGVPFLFLLVIFAALLCKPAFQSIYGLGALAFLLHATVDYPMQQRPAIAAWFFALSGVVVAWRTRVPRDDHGLLRGTGG